MKLIKKRMKNIVQQEGNYIKLKLIIHLYIILKTSVQQPINNIFFLIFFPDLARIIIFKDGSLINEIKE